MNNLILVTGSEGLVGSRFVEITKFKDRLHTPKIIELDILNKSELAAVLRSFDVSTIINFAAFTDVNNAEEQRGDKNGTCWKVNVEGVRNISEVGALYKNKIHLIHISTDMVFAGDKRDRGPYSENHMPEEDLDRVTWYGYTKGRGEHVVKDILGDRATILRIIYPIRSHFDGKLDYLRKPLKLFDEGRLYPMFSDQQVSVSFIDEVVTAIDLIVEKKICGVFHASSRDTSTPKDLLDYLLERVRGEKNAVKPIKVNEFLKNVNLPEYRYPRYGGLKVEATEKALGIRFSSCKEVIEKLIAQGIGKVF